MKNDDKEIEDDFMNPEYLIQGILTGRVDNKLKDLVKRISNYTGRKDITIEMLREVISKMDMVEVYLDKRTEKVRFKRSWQR